MDLVKVFENSKFGNVRVVLDENKQYWFVGKDVAECLGYSNTRDAVRTHVFEEDKGVEKVTTLGGDQKLTVINESGLYSLIFGSKLHNAREFRKWVTTEVLPSIRQNGLYATEDVMDMAINNPDMMINLLTNLKEERRKKEELEQQNRENKTIIKALVPKVQFAQDVLESNNSFPIRVIAKDYGMNSTNFNQLLKEFQIQFYDDNAEQWFLYSKYERNGYTKSETISVGCGFKTVTFWTEKGREFLYHFLKEKGFSPNKN